MKLKAKPVLFIIVSVFAYLLCFRYSVIAAQADDISGFYYQQGIDYEKEGKPEEAIGAYERAMEAFSSNKEFDSVRFRDNYRRLHSLYIENEKTDKIIELLEETIQHTEGLKEDELLKAYYGLGVSYMKKEEYGKSIEEFEKIVRIKPDFDPNIYYFMGNNFKNLSNKKDAVNNFNKYLELSPTGDFSFDAKESLKQLEEVKE